MKFAATANAAPLPTPLLAMITTHGREKRDEARRDIIRTVVAAMVMVFIEY